jgi:hypothetical protein
MPISQEKHKAILLDIFIVLAIMFSLIFTVVFYIFFANVYDLYLLVIFGIMGGLSFSLIAIRLIEYFVIFEEDSNQ